MFLAELNNLELWGADVGNAYLQALTSMRWSSVPYEQPLDALGF